MLCMSLQQTFPPNFEFKRLINSFQKYQNCWRSKKCVMDKMEAKMFGTGRNQNGTT